MFETEVVRLVGSWICIILALVFLLLAEKRRKSPDYIEKQKKQKEKHWRKVKLEMQNFRLNNKDK